MKKRTIKAISISLAIIFLAVFAVFSGLFLAMWDTGSSINEVCEMVMPNMTADNTSEEKKVIEVQEGDIKEAKDAMDDPSNRGVDKTQTLNPEEIDLAQPSNKNIIEMNDGTLVDKMSEEASKAQSEKEAALENETSSTEENAVAEKEKSEPRITEELMGVKTIVSAADKDNVYQNEIPSQTQQTPVAVSYDPLENFPLPFTEVDNSYFDDALFIGDSRVAGLAMNSGTNATFYAVTSFQVYRYKTFNVVQTPNGKVPIFDVMPYDRFTKIYIKVGLNELGSVTDEPFLNAYSSLINDLRVMQPRAIIYIQAILPVTAVKSQTDRTHCNENITKRNENLRMFAEANKCYFVDVGPYFADETGALRAETTADGIHMYGKYMPQWIDALRKQAVIWPPVQTSEEGR